MAENTELRKCQTSNELVLRIEYTIDDQYKAQGLREAGAPVSVRGDEKRVVVVRGDSIWERQTGTTWVDDKDAEKLTKEMEAIMKAIDETGGTGTPAQRLRLYEIMSKERPKIGEARRTDHIWVEVSPPGWSFSYDNIDRLGSKYVKTKALSLGERKRLASDSDFRGALHELAQDAEIASTGERTIAGYACQLTTVRSPARFEYCTAEIRGHEVELYRRIEQPDDFARIETAISVDVNPCIDDALFEVPDEVELVER